MSESPDLLKPMSCLRSPQREAKAANREADWKGELCRETGLHHQTRAVLAGGSEAAARLPGSGTDAVRPRVHQAGQRTGGSVGGDLQHAAMVPSFSAVAKFFTNSFPCHSEQV